MTSSTHDDADEDSYAHAWESAIALVRPKWTAAILATLAGGPLRLGDLLDEINETHLRPGEPPLSYKMLVTTLTHLVDADLVTKHKELDTFSPKSWYALAAHGRTLVQASRPLVKWHHGYSEARRDSSAGPVGSG